MEATFQKCAKPSYSITQNMMIGVRGTLISLLSLLRDEYLNSTVSIWMVLERIPRKFYHYFIYCFPHAIKVNSG